MLILQIFAISVPTTWTQGAAGSTQTRQNNNRYGKCICIIICPYNNNRTTIICISSQNVGNAISTAKTRYEPRDCS